MPADTGMAFVLVQHLDPDHTSMLGELLRPHTAMPVVDAQDQMALAATNSCDFAKFHPDLGRRPYCGLPYRPRHASNRRPLTLFASLAETRKTAASALSVGRRQRRTRWDQGD